MGEHRGESSWGYRVAQSLQVNHRESKTFPVVIFTFPECVIGIDNMAFSFHSGRSGWDPDNYS